MTLQEMIVSDSKGETEKSKGQCIREKDIFSFYAVKQKNNSGTETEVVIVRIMMPLGGELNGLYRFPRVGEKVVVAVEGTAHYLMGYLPGAETPFSETRDDKTENTDPFDKQGQVLRYKKTGENDSNRPYSEIGFYSETTEWKEKEGAANTKVDDASGLPVVDKVKIVSTGDVETSAQNYNEVSAKRIGLYAGYNDDISDRKIKQTENLKNNASSFDVKAFPVLPQDHKDQDPAFFQGDIQMRAKKRIVLKAEDTIEIVAGNSMIRLDSTGISLVSRKSSISAVNAWDSSITLSAREGVSIFGEKVSMDAALRFSISESFGSSISGLGGVMRIVAHDLMSKTLCKASYVLKGVSASVSFATNIASMGMGMDQDYNDTEKCALSNQMPSYFSLGAGVAGTAIAANWRLNTIEQADYDTAGNMMIMTDIMITILGLVTTVLDSLFLSETDQKKGGRSGLAMAAMVAEYGFILQMFIRLNVRNLTWFNTASYLMDFKGDIHELAAHHHQHTETTVTTKSALAGQGNLFKNVWNTFSGQRNRAIASEILGALALAVGAGTGAFFGYRHVSSVNEGVRKELEAL